MNKTWKVHPEIYFLKGPKNIGTNLIIKGMRDGSHSQHIIYAKKPSYFEMIYKGKF